ncbi:MAG: hypothetical protein KatS3mg110_1676 [Pirellulaceae bacterium]|nr:MAG: hypothetical protein KatS3mg110_1676 [Pirellulaceae bacterium]
MQGVNGVWLTNGMLLATPKAAINQIRAGKYRFMVASSLEIEYLGPDARSQTSLCRNLTSDWYRVSLTVTTAGLTLFTGASDPNRDSHPAIVDYIRLKYNFTVG